MLSGGGAADLVNVARGDDRLSQCRRVGPADIVNTAAFPKSNRLHDWREDRETCFLSVRCLPVRLTDVVGEGIEKHVFVCWYGTYPVESQAQVDKNRETCVFC